jgi:hypothetical protein
MTPLGGVTAHETLSRRWPALDAAQLDDPGIDGNPGAVGEHLSGVVNGR